MVARPTRCLWRNPIEAQIAQIKLIDKNIDQPHRVVLTDVIIQMFGEQSALAAIFAFNETLQKTLRQNNDRIISRYAF